MKLESETTTVAPQIRLFDSDFFFVALQWLLSHAYYNSLHVKAFGVEN